MAREFDTQPPRSCLRLYEARDSRSGGPAVAPSLGRILRVLAASRPGGIFLCLGHGAGEAGAWILDGMDLASRLVVVIEDSREAELLGAVLDDDLRVTVHVQDIAAFLVDVRDHRFDLVTELDPSPTAAVAGVALGRLAPGGFLMTRRTASALAEMLTQTRPREQGGERTPDVDAFALAHLPGELDVTLIAQRPARPPGRRRGGRRARADVTPLRASARRRSG